jgi:hypothetical protein
MVNINFQLTEQEQIGKAIFDLKDEYPDLPASLRADIAIAKVVAKLNGNTARRTLHAYN